MHGRHSSVTGPSPALRRLDPVQPSPDNGLDLVGAGGGRGGGGGGDGTGGPLRNRIRSLKGELIGSQSVPTAIQVTQLDGSLKELNDFVAQLNTAIATTMPNLYKQLADNNIGPGIGEPIKPIKLVGR